MLYSVTLMAKNADLDGLRTLALMTKPRHIGRRV